MGVTAVRLLSSLGLLVVIVQAQNCSRPVGGPNMNLKGNDILLTEFPNGKKVTFACNVGYSSAGGSPSSICTNGSWSKVGMKCERKSCGAVEEVENGRVDYKPGNEFGDTAKVICNTGYTAVGGKNPLSCEANGWDGRPPVCEVITCDSPPAVVDGSFSVMKDTYSYSETVRYTCKSGYTLNGTSQLTCSDNGEFKPNPPECIKVRCKEPEIPNGFWSSGARPPYEFSSTVTLKCNSGYLMIGNPVQKCEMNSQWGPGLPNCTPQPKTTTTTTSTTTTTTTTPSTPRKPDAEGCEDPKKINPELIVSLQPPYRESHKVTLSCPSGHKLGGASVVTCGKNGRWVPEIPKCETENGGNIVRDTILGVIGGIGGVGVIAGILRYFGAGPFKKKTEGSRRDKTDKEATNGGEDVALSQTS